MHHTFALTVDDELAKFIANYPGNIDPSALINLLYRNEMERTGFHPHPDTPFHKKESDHDD